MSILSRFKKDRLFQFFNPFTEGGNSYQESFYYLINSVEYDKDNKVSKVDISIIIGIQNYLQLKEHKIVKETYENSIPKHILLNIKAWENLLD